MCIKPKFSLCSGLHDGFSMSGFFFFWQVVLGIFHLLSLFTAAFRGKNKMLASLGQDEPCSLPEHILSSPQELIKHKARPAEVQILVRFRGSVLTLHWYIYSITVWSRAARRRIRFSLHFNKYKLPEYKEQKARHREGFVKLTDNNKHCVVWFCAHPGVLKSNCPWKKIKAFISLFRIPSIHWAWTCISGLECKWTKVCIMSLASQTANLLMSNQFNETKWDRWVFSVGFKCILEITTIAHTQITWNGILHLFNTYCTLSEGRRRRKRKRRRKRNRHASLLE